MSKYKYILFDVAGTLLHKPTFYSTFLKVLEKEGYFIESIEFKRKHKLLSEVIHFPDRTSRKFYDYFNTELLYLLGVIPTRDLLKKLFERCSYLPWEKFSDTDILKKIEIPKGIISNFNNTLKEKIDHFFDPFFSDILVSEELGVAKPSVDFYQKTLEHINVDANKILYIGDSIKLDIEPSIKLGINSLLIDRDCIFPSSTYRIDSLNEVLNYIYE
ncbi:HAD family hydrolase [Aquimarina sp. SS2-1]|uniref:HAD family hydrolase n=1 Tax=Aquimarina besae TaxID=3342247 RepID=UPI00366E407F